MKRSVFSGRIFRCAAISVWLSAAFTFYAQAADGPNDSYYQSKGSWQQDYDDQWGLKRIGFTSKTDATSAWHLTKDTKPVVVAVIDTGLDYFHPDIDPKSVWRNPKEKPNGKDDDNNGYIDDLIGWDFVEQDNNPWDWTGHGTHTAGIIAAATGNGEGIASVNPNAIIMPLRALNIGGSGYSTRIANAIYYAVDQGAQVINLSLATDSLSELEKQAVDYAYSKDVLIVTAAGNLGVDASTWAPAAFDKVITVAATDEKDKRTGFSNWGLPIDIAAPGTNILSLRARRTDIMLMASEGTDYKIGSHAVGAEARYYRVSGTSFAAPFVTGVASLILAKNPKLKPDQVKRMLLQSARDIEVPGLDQYTGYGLLDARAALTADPKFYIDAHIAGVKAVKKGKATWLQINGSVSADRFGKAWLEIGPGEHPEQWRQVGKPMKKPPKKGVLGEIDANNFRGAKVWTIRVISEHKNKKRREARFKLNVGG